MYESSKTELDRALPSWILKVGGPRIHGAARDEIPEHLGPARYQHHYAMTLFLSSQAKGRIHEQQRSRLA